MSLRWLLPLWLWFLPADVHSADIILRCTTERRVDVQPDPRSQDQSFRVKIYRRESFFLVWQSTQNELALLGRAWAGSFPITLPCVECTSAPPGARTTYASAQLFTTQAVCRSFSGRGKTELGHELIDTVDDTNLIDGRLIDKPARNGAGEQVS